MESIIPFDEWISIIEHYYYYSNTKVRKSIAPWNHAPHVSALALGHLSDEEIEDPIYGSYAIKKLQCIDFCNRQVSDATILLHFRCMLEEHALKKLFCFCQESPGWRRLSYEWCYDYRCEDHQSIIKAASLTKKPYADTRPCDALFKKWQPVVFLYEGAYRCRRWHRIYLLIIGL